MAEVVQVAPVVSVNFVESSGQYVASHVIGLPPLGSGQYVVGHVFGPLSADSGQCRRTTFQCRLFAILIYTFPVPVETAH